MSMEMAGRSPPFGPRIITLGLWSYEAIFKQAGALEFIVVVSVLAETSEV